MAEPDVETEIYERLYGLPRRERQNGGPEQPPIVIVDGGIRAGTGAGEASEGPVWPRSAGRRRGHPVPLGHELNRLGGEVLEAAAVAGRWVRDELPPTVDAAKSAVRRRPVMASAVAAALIAVLLVALLLSAGGSSKAARVRLAAPLPPQPALAPAPPTTPRTARGRSAPHPTDTPAETSAGPASATGMSTTTQRRPSKAHVLKRRTPTRRPTRVAPRPSRPAPIKQPTAHERPAHSPPATTTPSTPPVGTGPPNVTGGQPAPPG